jgi:hypothetical protein
MQQMYQERGGAPLAATDPQFLYLYGRALLESGYDRDALAAFRQTIKVVRQSATQTSIPDAAMIERIELELRSSDAMSLRRASTMLDEMIEATSSQRAAHLTPREIVSGSLSIVL